MLRLITNKKNNAQRKYYFAIASALLLVGIIFLTIFINSKDETELENDCWLEDKNAVKQNKSNSADRLKSRTRISENPCVATQNGTHKNSVKSKAKPKFKRIKIGSELTDKKLSTEQFAELKKNISAIVASYEKNRKTKIGIEIFDLANQENLYSKNKNKMLIPASNQKVVTTLASLEKLGKDYNFSTKIYLQHNWLILLGDFDPTLGDAKLCKQNNRSIFQKIDLLSRRCAQNIAGNKIEKLIIAKQVSKNNFHPPSWAKRYKNHWYGAPVSSLIFHDNCVDVTFKIIGEKVYPKVVPSGKLFKLIDKTRKGTKQVWSLRSNCKKGTLTVKGKVKTSSSFAVSAPIDNPIYFVGRVVAGRLINAGVNLKPIVSEAKKSEIDFNKATLVAEIKSPIKPAIERANINSLNIAAEALFLKFGAGDWGNSSKEITTLLVDKMGLEKTQLAVFDGSGLSRKNNISPANFLRLLKLVTKKKYASLFYNSLSLGGREGTLRKRFKNKKYRGRVIAKTGYISGVVCLTGYILDSENRPAFAFSFMLNKVRSVRDAKQMIDNCCRKIIDKIDKIRQAENSKPALKSKPKIIEPKIESKKNSKCDKENKPSESQKSYG